MASGRGRYWKAQYEIAEKERHLLHLAVSLMIKDDVITEGHIKFYKLVAKDIIEKITSQLEGRLNNGHQNNR